MQYRKQQAFYCNYTNSFDLLICSHCYLQSMFWLKLCLLFRFFAINCNNIYVVYDRNTINCIEIQKNFVIHKLKIIWHDNSRPCPKLHPKKLPCFGSASCIYICFSILPSSAKKRPGRFRNTNMSKQNLKISVTPYNGEHFFFVHAKPETK